MFSGIVEGVGRIVAVEQATKGVRIRVDCGAVTLEDVRVGDSIALSGCCLTVIERTGQFAVFDVSRETLDCTVNLGAPGPVNLEKALRLSDRLGGHLVTGHVDGVGKVTCFEQAGESWLLEVEVPRELRRYIARKGSITVDGVSLTVAAVSGSRVEIALIPHTLEVTTLGRRQPGDRVNIEVDILAKYVERLMEIRS